MPSHRQLTERQRTLLLAVEQRATAGRPCPTYTELAKALGVTSVHGIHQHVGYVVEKGYLLNLGGARGLVLTNAWCASREVEGVHFHYGPCRPEWPVCQRHMRKAERTRPRRTG